MNPNRRNSIRHSFSMPCEWQPAPRDAMLQALFGNPADTALLQALADVDGALAATMLSHATDAGTREVCALLERKITLMTHHVLFSVPPVVTCEVGADGLWLPSDSTDSSPPASVAVHCVLPGAVHFFANARVVHENAHAGQSGLGLHFVDFQGAAARQWNRFNLTLGRAAHSHGSG